MPHRTLIFLAEILLVSNIRIRLVLFLSLFFWPASFAVSERKEEFYTV